MTQEEKSLLLQDLSARLPYGVKVLNMAEGVNELCELDSIMTSRKHKDNIFVSLTLLDDSVMTGIEMVKPYLRPMSSMTEEEKEELKEIGSEYLEKWENAQDSIDKWRLDAEVSCKRSEFYNSHLLDWHGLIPKGLAIEAPKDIYDSNSKVD